MDNVPNPYAEDKKMKGRKKEGWLLRVLPEHFFNHAPCTAYRTDIVRYRDRVAESCTAIAYNFKAIRVQRATSFCTAVAFHIGVFIDKCVEGRRAFCRDRSYGFVVVGILRAAQYLVVKNLCFLRRLPTEGNILAVGFCCKGCNGNLHCKKESRARKEEGYCSYSSHRAQM